MVAPFGKVKAQEAAEALAKEAWARWIQEEGHLDGIRLEIETLRNVVDDITVILCWL